MHKYTWFEDIPLDKSKEQKVYFDTLWWAFEAMLIWLLFIHKIKNWNWSNLCYVHLLVIFFNDDNFFIILIHNKNIYKQEMKKLVEQLSSFKFFWLYHSLYMLS